GRHPYDRFVKNTTEILSPLNELTSRQLLSQHEFLTPDRKVQRTLFGNGPAAVEVIVNASAKDFRCHTSSEFPEAVLPPYGFLVYSAEFVAFCGRKFGGLEYETPSLFTLRSLDGKPLMTSSRVRVFHGFGSPRVRLGNTTQSVDKEAEISFVE